MNYGKYEGQLCRMLEEPVPLTPDAEMPCLTRLIQDDSRMGMFNRDTKPSRLSDFYPVARIVSNHIVVDEFMESDYHRFEIIGTPVKEGSDKWALYQIMQGRKVCCSNAAYTALSMGSTTNIGAYNIGHPIHGGYYCTVDTFLLESVKTGWQLYEEPKPKPKQDKTHPAINGYNRYDYIPVDGIKMPKPEPPKEPDYVICKRCGGSQSIPNPDVSNTAYATCPKCGGTGYEIKETIANCENCKHVCTNSNIDHCHMYEPKEEKESPIDPVEMPLRKLILQAMEEGKNIRTFYQDMVFTPVALTGLLANGRFRWWNICNWELTTREQNYFPSISTSSDRPNPTYKVGDWVEWCGDQYMVESAPPQSGGRYDILSPYDELGCSVYPENITRKLSPSEIVVRIGCLSGTVEDLSYEENGKFWLIGKATERHPIDMYVILYDEMLDTPTSNLVESLLKAQEEESND